MAILWNIIKFSLSVFIIYYLPGFLLIDNLKTKASVWENVILSFCAGLFVVPQFYSYLEAINAHNLFLIVIVLSGLIYFIYKLKPLFLNKQKREKSSLNLKLEWSKVFLLGIVLIVILVASLTISTSGMIYKDGLRFYQANAYDSVAQLSMVQELSKEPAHELPFSSGIPLKGYYAGSFYWRAVIQKWTNINPVDLFFRFCPLFLFPLIVAMTFVTIKNITGNKHVGILATFLIFLMSDLSWAFPVIDRLFPFIGGIKTIDLMGNLLHGFIFNPPFAHGVLILFTGCYFLKDCDLAKGRNRLWLTILFTGFLFGSLYEYKTFMWAIVLPALILTGIKEYFLDKKTLFLKIGFVAILFSVASYLRTSLGNKTLSLFRVEIGYYPVAIFKEMGLLNPEIQAGFLVILAAFLFYLIGALGIKIVGFYKIYQYLKRLKNIPSAMLFFILAVLLSFIFTHSLLLKSNYFYATYNFFSIFFIFICIFAGKMIYDWTKNARMFLKIMVFVAVFILGMGSTAFSFLGYFPGYSKYKIVTKDELEAIDYIRKNSRESDVILYYDIAQKDWIMQKDGQRVKESGEGRDSFISALTKRRVVSECNWHLKIGNYVKNLDQRQADIRSFFSTKNKNLATSILDRYGVNYVWIKKGYGLNFDKSGLIKIVFSNPQVEIYKRK